MKLEEIMEKALIADPEDGIHEVTRDMVKNRAGYVLIKHGTRIGILTETDILEKVIIGGLDIKKTKVKDIMTQPCITIDSDASLEDASDIFNKNNIRRLPVIKDGKIVGIITSRILAKNLCYMLLRKRKECGDGPGGKSSLRR